MPLKGTPELRARLKAIRQTFKPVGKLWAETTVVEARARVRKRTGKTAASFRVRNATQRKAVVVGSFVANLIDAGTKEHDIKPRRVTRLKFQGRAAGPGFGTFTSDTGGRTIFAKKVHHPRTGAHPFKKAAALASLRKHPMAESLIRQWNEAAR